MITFNNFYRLITGLANGRFVYQQQNPTELSDEIVLEPETGEVTADPLSRLDMNKFKMSEEAKKALEETAVTAEQMKDVAQKTLPSHDEVKDWYKTKEEEADAATLKSEEKTEVAQGEGKMPDIEFKMVKAEATQEEMTQAKQDIVDLANKNAELPPSQRVSVVGAGLTEDQKIDFRNFQEPLDYVVEGVSYKNKFTADQILQLADLYNDTLNAALKTKRDTEIARKPATATAKPDEFLASLEPKPKEESKKEVSSREKVIAAGEATKKTVEDSRLAYMKKQMENPTEEQVRDWVGYAYRLAGALSDPAANIDNVIEGLRGSYSENDARNIVYMGEIAKYLRKQGKEITTESLVGVLKGYASNDKVKSRLDRQVGFFA